MEELNQENSNAWQVPQETVAVPNSPIKNKFLSNLLKDKKRLLLLVGILLEAILLIVFIVIGTWLFKVGSTQRLLRIAGENLVKTKNMSTNFRIGVSGFSLDGSVKVDKDQNMDVAIKTPFGTLGGIYINEKDNFYFKDAFSDMFSSYGSVDTGTVTNEKIAPKYIEYKNVKKAIVKYTDQTINASVFDPKKNYFTTENIKFIKRLEDEKIDGKNLFKYSFTPSKEYLDKLLETAQKDSKSPVTLEKSDVKIDFWIEKKTLRIEKIKGTINVQIKGDEDISYMMPEDKLEINWEENFSYDFKDTISLPKDADITDSIDIMEELDPSRSEKTQIRSDGKSVQTALESYYARNKQYPDSLEQIKNDQYLYYASDIDFSNIEYKKSGNDYTLTLKYKGEKFDELGTNVSTSSTSSSSAKANDTKKKADFHEIQNALEQYFVDYDKYPLPTTWEGELVDDYFLSTTPTAMARQSGGNPYIYSGDGKSYTLRVELQYQNDSGSNVITENGKKYYQVTSKQ